MLIGVCVFVFFKQKTAYEMRISDWSSDVCSSDLRSVRAAAIGERQLLQEDFRRREVGDRKGHAEDAIAEPAELGRIARHELDDRVVTDLKGAAPVAPGGRNLNAAHEALIGLGRRGNVDRKSVV